LTGRDVPPGVGKISRGGEGRVLEEGSGGGGGDGRGALQGRDAERMSLLHREVGSDLFGQVGLSAESHERFHPESSEGQV
jgi:hypothetical protein